MTRVALHQGYIGELYGTRGLSEIEGESAGDISPIHRPRLGKRLPIGGDVRGDLLGRAQKLIDISATVEVGVNPLIQGTPRRETGRIGSVLVDGYSMEHLHTPGLLLAGRIDISDDRSVGPLATSRTIELGELPTTRGQTAVNEITTAR